MKIGYLVEGSTDRAVIVGLRDQLCPAAELVDGAFRGSLKGVGRRRELPKACAALREQGADVIVDLNDANELAWHKRREQEYGWAPLECTPLLVIGAPEPNIEAWLIADAAYFEKHTGHTCRPTPQDPKPLAEKAFGITALDHQESAVTAFVRGADLRAWTADNSFSGFLREVRERAKSLGCSLNA